MVAEQILVTVRDVTHSWGGELVMVYLPDSRRYCSDVPAWRESCGTDYTRPGDGVGWTIATTCWRCSPAWRTRH